MLYAVVAQKLIETLLSRIMHKSFEVIMCNILFSTGKFAVSTAKGMAGTKSVREITHNATEIRSNAVSLHAFKGRKKPILIRNR